MTADVRDTGPLLVGVDVGGSKIAVLVVDANERVLAREVAPTSVGAQDRAVDEIATVVHKALDTAGAAMTDVAAVGVGVPGRVDPLTGAVTLAVNLGWSDLPLGSRLEARLGRPCVVENDVRAAAFGLHHRRVVGDIHDLAYLAVGTGIAAGVVLDGRLHRGARGLAGEIGHAIVDPEGPECACGQHGCLEAYASGPAIARRAVDAVGRGRPSALTDADPQAITAREVYRAATDGDPLACELVEDVGRRLAWAIHLLVMAYDVDRVVVGGGVSHAGATFMDPIQRELDRLRGASPQAGDLLPDGVVEPLSVGADAGAWGAVSIANQAVAGLMREEVRHD